jgi:hypothetical protein
MTDTEQIQEHRREAVLASLAIADPDRAEARFKEFFGAGSGAWSAWDQGFVDFIEQHRAAPLLFCSAGHDFYVLFSPSAKAGFWVLAQPGGTHGKGRLSERDVEKLNNLAAQKGLVNLDG